jgi:hypothetical protein
MNHTYEYLKQYSIAPRAVNHELVLTIQRLTNAALISLQHLLGERVHPVWYNYHITTRGKYIIMQSSNQC